MNPPGIDTSGPPAAVNVLGIDTSGPVSAACVVRADGRAFEHEPLPEALTGAPAHGRELLPAIVRCLADAELTFPELDVIAVGVGPGAFTGLRVGVTTARALAHAGGTRTAAAAPSAHAGRSGTAAPSVHARGAELRPVSSLAALAAGSGEALALALIDAGRGEVFAALFEDGAARWPPFAAAPEAVAKRVREAGIDPLAAGNGSVRFRDALAAAGVRMAPAGSGAHVVSGRSICRLAARSAPVPADAVVPHYLRLPDAQPSRDRPPASPSQT